MKKETAFWREDHVRKALKSLGTKLTAQVGELAFDTMKKEFDEVALLLVYLYLDLKLKPHIKSEYISKMKDSYAKETALSAFTIAGEIAKGPSVSQL